MSTRLKAIAPLTLSIGILAFLASEVALNFTFHWVTVQDGVFGKYGLPHGFHLVLPFPLFDNFGQHSPSRSFIGDGNGPGRKVSPRALLQVKGELRIC